MSTPNDELAAAVFLVLVEFPGATVETTTADVKDKVAMLVRTHGMRTDDGTTHREGPV